MSKKLEDGEGRFVPSFFTADEYYKWCTEFEYWRGIVAEILKREKKSIKLQPERRKGE